MQNYLQGLFQLSSFVMCTHFKGEEPKHGEFKEQDRNGLSTKAKQVIGLLVKGKEGKEQKKNDTPLPKKDLKVIKTPVVKRGGWRKSRAQYFQGSSVADDLSFVLRCFKERQDKGLGRHSTEKSAAKGNMFSAKSLSFIKQNKN